MSSAPMQVDDGNGNGEPAPAATAEQRARFVETKALFESVYNELNRNGTLIADKNRKRDAGEALDVADYTVLIPYYWSALLLENLLPKITFIAQQEFSALPEAQRKAFRAAVGRFAGKTLDAKFAKVVNWFDAIEAGRRFGALSRERREQPKSAAELEYASEFAIHVFNVLYLEFGVQFEVQTYLNELRELKVAKRRAANIESEGEEEFQPMETDVTYTLLRRVYDEYNDFRTTWKELRAIRNASKRVERETVFYNAIRKLIEQIELARSRNAFVVEALALAQDTLSLDDVRTLFLDADAELSVAALTALVESRREERRAEGLRKQVKARRAGTARKREREREQVAELRAELEKLNLKTQEQLSSINEQLEELDAEQKALLGSARFRSTSKRTISDIEADRDRLEAEEERIEAQAGAERDRLEAEIAALDRRINDPRTRAPRGDGDDDDDGDEEAEGALNVMTIDLGSMDEGEFERAISKLQQYFSGLDRLDVPRRIQERFNAIITLARAEIDLDRYVPRVPAIALEDLVDKLTKGEVTLADIDRPVGAGDDDDDDDDEEESGGEGTAVVSACRRFVFPIEKIDLDESALNADDAETVRSVSIAELERSLLPNNAFTVEVREFEAGTRQDRTAELSRALIAQNESMRNAVAVRSFFSPATLAAAVNSFSTGDAGAGGEGASQQQIEMEVDEDGDPTITLDTKRTQERIRKAEEFFNRWLKFKRVAERRGATVALTQQQTNVLARLLRIPSSTFYIDKNGFLTRVNHFDDLDTIVARAIAKNRAIASESSLQRTMAILEQQEKEASEREAAEQAERRLVVPQAPRFAAENRIVLVENRIVPTTGTSLSSLSDKLLAGQDAAEFQRDLQRLREEEDVFEERTAAIRDDDELSKLSEAQRERLERAREREERRVEDYIQQFETVLKRELDRDLRRRSLVERVKLRVAAGGDDFLPSEVLEFFFADEELPGGGTSGNGQRLDVELSIESVAEQVFDSPEVVAKTKDIPLDDEQKRAIRDRLVKDASFVLGKENGEDELDEEVLSYDDARIFRAGLSLASAELYDLSGTQPVLKAGITKRAANDRLRKAMREERVRILNSKIDSIAARYAELDSRETVDDADFKSLLDELEALNLESESRGLSRTQKQRAAKLMGNLHDRLSVVDAEHDAEYNTRFRNEATRQSELYAKILFDTEEQSNLLTSPQARRFLDVALNYEIKKFNQLLVAAQSEQARPGEMALERKQIDIERNRRRAQLLVDALSAMQEEEEEEEKKPASAIAKIADFSDTSRLVRRLASALKKLDDIQQKQRVSFVAGLSTEKVDEARKAADSEFERDVERAVQAKSLQPIVQELEQDTTRLGNEIFRDFAAIEATQRTNLAEVRYVIYTSGMLEVFDVTDILDRRGNLVPPEAIDDPDRPELTAVGYMEILYRQMELLKDRFDIAYRDVVLWDGKLEELRRKLTEAKFGVEAKERRALDFYTLRMGKLYGSRWSYTAAKKGPRVPSFDDEDRALMGHIWQLRRDIDRFLDVFERYLSSKALEQADADMRRLFAEAMTFIIAAIESGELPQGVTARQLEQFQILLSVARPIFSLVHTARELQNMYVLKYKQTLQLFEQEKDLIGSTSTQEEIINALERFKSIFSSNANRIGQGGNVFKSATFRKDAKKSSLFFRLLPAFTDDLRERLEDLLRSERRDEAMPGEEDDLGTEAQNDLNEGQPNVASSNAGDELNDKAFEGLEHNGVTVLGYIDEYLSQTDVELLRDFFAYQSRPRRILSRWSDTVQLCTSDVYGGGRLYTEPKAEELREQVATVRAKSQRNETLSEDERVLLARDEVNRLTPLSRDSRTNFKVVPEVLRPAVQAFVVYCYTNNKVFSELASNQAFEQEISALYGNLAPIGADASYNLYSDSEMFRQFSDLKLAREDLEEYAKANLDRLSVDSDEYTSEIVSKLEDLVFVWYSYNEARVRAAEMIATQIFSNKYEALRAEFTARREEAGDDSDDFDLDSEIEFITQNAEWAVAYYASTVLSSLREYFDEYVYRPFFDDIIFRMQKQYLTYRADDGRIASFEFSTTAELESELRGRQDDPIDTTAQFNRRFRGRDTNYRQPRFERPDFEEVDDDFESDEEVFSDEEDDDEDEVFSLGDDDDDEGTETAESDEDDEDEELSRFNRDFGDLNMLVELVVEQFQDEDIVARIKATKLQAQRAQRRRGAKRSRNTVEQEEEAAAVAQLTSHIRFPVVRRSGDSAEVTLSRLRFDQFVHLLNTAYIVSHPSLHLLYLAFYSYGVDYWNGKDGDDNMVLPGPRGFIFPVLEVKRGTQRQLDTVARLLNEVHLKRFEDDYYKDYIGVRMRRFQNGSKESAYVLFYRRKPRLEEADDDDDDEKETDRLLHRYIKDDEAEELLQIAEATVFLNAEVVDQRRQILYNTLHVTTRVYGLQYGLMWTYTNVYAPLYGGTGCPYSVVGSQVTEQQRRELAFTNLFVYDIDQSTSIMLAVVDASSNEVLTLKPPLLKVLEGVQVAEAVTTSLQDKTFVELQADFYTFLYEVGDQSFREYSILAERQQVRQFFDRFGGATTGDVSKRSRRSQTGVRSHAQFAVTKDAVDRYAELARFSGASDFVRSFRSIWALDLRGQSGRVPVSIDEDLLDRVLPRLQSADTSNLERFLEELQTGRRAVSTRVFSSSRTVAGRKRGVESGESSSSKKRVRELLASQFIASFIARQFAISAGDNDEFKRLRSMVVGALAPHRRLDYSTLGRHIAAARSDSFELCAYALSPGDDDDEEQSQVSAEQQHAFTLQLCANHSTRLHSVPLQYAGAQYDVPCSRYVRVSSRIRDKWLAATHSLDSVDKLTDEHRRNARLEPVLQTYTASASNKLVNAVDGGIRAIVARNVGDDETLFYDDAASTYLEEEAQLRADKSVAADEPLFRAYTPNVLDVRGERLAVGKHALKMHASHNPLESVTLLYDSVDDDKFRLRGCVVRKLVFEPKKKK